jgi:ABC-type nitrate/sulfonate/bicarbonate transport system substrate-binding protein
MTSLCLDKKRLTALGSAPSENRSAMAAILFLLSFFLLMFQPAAAAEIKAQNRRVILAYTSISPSHAPAWIAKEMKIFDKNGINAEVV